MIPAPLWTMRTYVFGSLEPDSPIGIKKKCHLQESKMPELLLIIINKMFLVFDYAGTDFVDPPGPGTLGFFALLKTARV